MQTFHHIAPADADDHSQKTGWRAKHTRNLRLKTHAISELQGSSALPSNKDLATGQESPAALPAGHSLPLTVSYTKDMPGLQPHGLPAPGELQGTNKPCLLKSHPLCHLPFTQGSVTLAQAPCKHFWTQNLS